MQEKAFELHHGQMARSVNPYATTLFYANVLEDMSKIDEAGETSDIPAWIRALYVMERNFDGWNEALREKLLASQVALAKNYKAQKLAEYRESVSQLNVRRRPASRPALSPPSLPRYLFYFFLSASVASFAVTRTCCCVVCMC